MTLDAEALWSNRRRSILKYLYDQITSSSKKIYNMDINVQGWNLKNNTKFGELSDYDRCIIFEELGTGGTRHTIATVQFRIVGKRNDCSQIDFTMKAFYDMVDAVQDAMDIDTISIYDYVVPETPVDTGEKMICIFDAEGSRLLDPDADPMEYVLTYNFRSFHESRKWH